MSDSVFAALAHPARRSVLRLLQRNGPMPVGSISRELGIVVAAAGTLLMTALSWRSAGRLPDPVLFPGAGNDGAGQQMPENFVLASMPLLTLLVSAALLTAQRMRHAVSSRFRIPLWRDDLTHRRAVALLAVLAGNSWPEQKIIPSYRVRVSPGSALDAALDAYRRSLLPTGVAVMLTGLVALASSGTNPLLSLGLSLLAVLILAGATVRAVGRSAKPRI